MAPTNAGPHTSPIPQNFRDRIMVASAHAGDAPFVLGRDGALQSSVEQIMAGTDIVIEADDGLGRAELSLAIEHVLCATGQWRSVAVDEVSMLTGDSGDVIVRVDLEEATPSDLARLAAIPTHSDVRLIMTRRPAQPFVQAKHTALVDRTTRPTHVLLSPLTADEIDALINEQVVRTEMRAEPSRAERLWVSVNSAGYPGLAVALLHDCDEAADDEGSLERFTRTALVEASSVIAGLTPFMQELARALVQLVGTDTTRLTHAFDPVELSLLMETKIVDDYRGILTIAPPFQAALRLLPPSAQRQRQVNNIIFDITASYSAGARCNEDEILLASAALMADPELRESVSQKTQREVLAASMFLTRRRGDSEYAASLARRMMTSFPGVSEVSVGAIARGEPDPLSTFASVIPSADPQHPAGSWWIWVSCLQLPLLHVPPGAIDTVRAARQWGTASEQASLEALASTLEAAQMLNDGDVAGARELVAFTALRGDIDPAVRARATVVEAAACAWQLDHAGLRAADAKYLDMVSQLRWGESTAGDLAARTTIDGLVTMGLCFGAAGLQRDSRVDEIVNSVLTDVMLRGEITSVASLIMALVLQGLQFRDDDSVIGATRFLRRTRGTGFSRWVVAQIDGVNVSARDPYRMRSRFVRVAWNTMRQTSLAVPELVDDVHRECAVSDVHAECAFSNPDAGAPTTMMSRLAGAYWEVLNSDDFRSVSVDADLIGLDATLEDESVAWIYAKFLAGLFRAEPREAIRAVSRLITIGTIGHAERALAHVAQLEIHDDADRQKISDLQQRLAERARPESEVVLTKRERQVSLLAAQGLANRDIARQLFLSVRTVESHMYRAMRKLMVPREELSVAMLMRIGVEG